MPGQHEIKFPVDYDQMIFSQVPFLDQVSSEEKKLF